MDYDVDIAFTYSLISHDLFRKVGTNQIYYQKPSL